MTARLLTVALVFPLLAWSWGCTSTTDTATTQPSASHNTDANPGLDQTPKPRSDTRRIKRPGRY